MWRVLQTYSRMTSDGPAFLWFPDSGKDPIKQSTPTGQWCHLFLQPTLRLACLLVLLHFGQGRKSLVPCYVQVLWWTLMGNWLLSGWVTFFFSYRHPPREPPVTAGVHVVLVFAHEQGFAPVQLAYLCECTLRSQSWPLDLALPWAWMCQVWLRARDSFGDGSMQSKPRQADQCWTVFEEKPRVDAHPKKSLFRQVRCTFQGNSKGTPPYL